MMAMGYSKLVMKAIPYLEDHPTARNPGDRKSQLRRVIQHFFVGELTPETLGPVMIRGMIHTL